jgi:SAM-dependent methyltransferase
MKRSQKEIFRAERLPLLQNRLYNNAEQAKECAVGNVVLVVNPLTSIITNDVFESGKVIYDREYNNEQASSASFRTHLDYVADLISRNFDHSDVIEVGCGKGVFIEYLRRRQFEVTGLDPTYDGEDPAVQKRLFERGLGLRANGIVLRHVLEHIENPVEFLKAISDANGGVGRIYIEVPCFDWICENRAWFDVFYEHVNYFRMSDFDRIFSSIHHAERTFGGQYLSIVADLDSIREPDELDSRNKNVPDLVFEAGRVAEGIRDWKNTSGGSVAVWGAGSKGVIFSIHMTRYDAMIDYVIDINSDKVGKFLPCTGIEVISPEAFMSLAAPGTRIFVMNPNYLEEIKTLTGGGHNYECV